MLHVVSHLESRPAASEVGRGMGKRFFNEVKDDVMKKEVRKLWLNVRLNQAEYDRLNLLFKKSVCQQLSEYARLVLLQKPVTIYHRNQSLDEFLVELIKLKNELAAIGNNYNQVVHKLHMLDTWPEVKAWQAINEAGKKNFNRKMDEIVKRMNEVYELWSEK